MPPFSPVKAASKFRGDGKGYGREKSKKVGRMWQGEAKNVIMD
jgi:hypothetical protein